MTGILAIMMLVMAGIAVWYLSVWVRSHNAYSGGVKNHNENFTEFRYQVALNRQQVLEKLEHPGQEDRLSYEFDRERLKIRFYSPLTQSFSPCAYQLSMAENPRGIVLTVTQLNAMPNGKYPYLQNEFWCDKLGAVPIEL